MLTIRTTSAIAAAAMVIGLGFGAMAASPTSHTMKPSMSHHISSTVQSKCEKEFGADKAQVAKCIDEKGDLSKMKH